MNKQKVVLTDEKFQEIYSSEELRNQVAYAHKSCDQHGKFLNWITCSYPVTYVVTEEQKRIANEHRLKCKKEKIASIGNKLVFVGMGMSYSATEETDVCNFRIRTEFKNENGRHFFVELEGGPGYKTFCPFSIDRDLEIEYEEKKRELYAKRDSLPHDSWDYRMISDRIKDYQRQPYYNYKNLQQILSIPYKLENIKQWINVHFDCKFTEIEIDNYNLTTEDFICQSL